MPITWDEAYDEIVRRLDAVRREDGADAVAFFSGYTKWYRTLLKRFAYSFGSVNYGTESSVCFDATFMAWAATTGSFAVPDLDHAATTSAGDTAPTTRPPVGGRMQPSGSGAAGCSL